MSFERFEKIISDECDFKWNRLIKIDSSLKETSQFILENFYISDTFHQILKTWNEQYHKDYESIESEFGCLETLIFIETDFYDTEYYRAMMNGF